MNVHPKTNSRRFAIRAACLFFFASAIGLGYFFIAREPEKSPEHIRILEQLRDCDPCVKWNMGEAVEVYLEDPIANFNLDDGDLALLAQIPTLRVLRISFAPYVSDTGMSHVSELKQLRALVVKFTPIGDESVASLNGLSELRSLILYDTDVTDAGLNHVVEIPSLSTLDLRRSAVGDGGLLVLAESRSLVNLLVTVDGSKITEDGVDRLRKEAPELAVACDAGPNPPFSATPPSRIMGNYFPPEDRTLVLVAETTEGRTVTQLVCSLTEEQLAGIGIKASEAEDRGPSLFEAIRSKLPESIVDWFARRLPPEKPATLLTDRELDALLQDGLAIQFEVGCRDGDGIFKYWTIK